MEIRSWKKTIAVCVLVAFAGTGVAWALEQSAPSFQEKDGPPVVKKHKKFPWLPAILGIAAAGIILCVVAKKKKTTVPPVKPPTQFDYEQMVHLFDYDAQLPIDVQETQVEDRGTAKVHHISFASPKGGRNQSLLVVPAGQGPFAGVVFLHWGQGDMYEFLEEAVDMAGHGVVSIMISEHGYSNVDFYIRIVVDLRRAVDLLLSRSDVAAGRIGYVGHSLGATWGGVLAGIEKRVKAYVLMCGHGKIGSCANCNENVPENMWAYHYISHAAPAALLFQFARNDEWIANQAAEEYFQAASEPKSILWYDAPHELNAQARLDRFNWLKMQLGLH